MGQSGSCGDHTVHQVQCGEFLGYVGGGRLLPAVLDEPGEGGDLGLGAVVAQSLGGETVVVRGDREVCNCLLQCLGRGEVRTQAGPARASLFSQTSVRLEGVVC